MKPFDANGAFVPTGKGAGLRRVAVRGAGVTIFSQGVVFVAQIGSTMILARLLAPDDFGLITMVTTFSLLLTNFGLNGFTEAIIQRDELDEALASNLFWINFAVMLVLTLGFAAAGTLLARFYADARVAQVTEALSLSILLSGLAVVHLALLKRAMNFTAASLNDVVAYLVSIAVMIGMARVGEGYWALVVGNLVRPLLQAAGAWYLCPWVPRLPRRAAGTASTMSFAMHVYGRFCLNYSTRNTDNLLVGWRFGPASLGFYKKAYDLFVTPANQLLTPVNEVALSTLSRLERGSNEYKRAFLAGLSLLAFVGMGVGAALTVEAADLIRLLLGPQWTVAAQIFRYFGPGIGIMLIYNCIGMIHLSLGRADRWLRWVLVELSVTVLMFVIGLQWGRQGVAAAWTLSFWILTLPAFWYAGRPIRFGIKPIIAAVWKFAAASLLAGVACEWMLGEIPGLMSAAGTLGALARILAMIPVFSGLYIGAVVLLHGGTEPITRFSRLLPELIPWRVRSGRLARTEPEAAGS